MGLARRRERLGGFGGQQVAPLDLVARVGEALELVARAGMADRAVVEPRRGGRVGEVAVRGEQLEGDLFEPERVADSFADRVQDVLDRE